MGQIRLRRLINSDATQLANLANNKNIWDNLRDYIPYPYNKNDAISFIEFTQKESPQQTFGIIIDQDKLCGVISLAVQTDIYKLTAEIGYWIGEKYWGKGIATEAIGLITKYGFEQLELERIHAGVFKNNIGSMRVLLKNGYQKEGVFRNSIIKNGEIFDEHRFSKLKNE